MNEPAELNILVAVDGSRRSIETVRYLTRLPKLKHANMNLFHVYNKVPESHYDLSREPASLNLAGQLIAWEKSQRQAIEGHMGKCRKILLAADFRSGRIETTISNRSLGIARDIMAESRKSYDAVILRRRGMSKLSGLIMGSVASKLLNGVDAVPLVFAGRKTVNNRLLVGMDPSQGAFQAVDFVGKMAGGLDYDIKLISVLRNGFPGHPPSPGETDGNDGIKTETTDIEGIFHQARSRLEAAGCDGGRIHFEIVKNSSSRSGALLNAAEKGDYSTLIVGRKGVSRVSEFLMGRVSRKLLQIARKHHVWIVN